jgi:hypothetical protein
MQSLLDHNDHLQPIVSLVFLKNELKYNHMDLRVIQCIHIIIANY